MSTESFPYCLWREKVPFSPTVPYCRVSNSTVEMTSPEMGVVAISI
jgi:hypothetical protein